MESKGKRGLRATAPGATPGEVEVPPEAPIEAVKPIEEHIAAKALADTPPSATSLVAAPSRERAGKAPAPCAFSDFFADFGSQNFAAFIQSQTALARGLEALSAEMTGLTLSGIDVAARTATDMLAVKTIADAIEVNAGFTRRNFDTLIGGSAKLSELGVKVATEVSQPILAQLGKDWTRAASLAFWPA
jgi:broad specificity polyphosphatase/5'/3'-nucleotidase SurE